MKLFFPEADGTLDLLESQDSNRTSPQEFTCEYCNKKYKKYKSLSQHRSKYCVQNPNACRNRRFFQCPTCDYNSVFVSNMSRHMRTKHIDYETTFSPTDPAFEE